MARAEPVGEPGEPESRSQSQSVWEADDTEPVLDSTVASILRDAASRSPHITALVAGTADPASRRRWSYAELLADAQGAARALAARFGPSERVAVVAPSIPESLLLTYGAALAGLVLVPVNPALRAAELRHVLGQSGAAGAFVVSEHRGQDLAATLDALGPDLPALREVVAFDDWDAFTASAPSTGASDAVDLTTRTPSPDDVAQLVYTSGTTGTPKGALLTHRGMTNAARFGAMRFGMRAGDVYVQTMPLFHVGGQVVSFQLCQLSATAVLVPAFDPGLVLELVESERATLTCGVPTMLLALVDHPDFGRRDLSSLRAVSGGGAVVPAELVRHIEAALGVQFAVVFGQTEACGFISQTHLEDAAEDKGATLGRPLPGVGARVVDPESGAAVPRGEVGELEVRGPNVMAGYHELPGESVAAIGPGGWLRTGDLVTMDDRGYLRMTGRRKEMIVSGGENIFPVEIENALLEHPAVTQVAVVGVPDPRWGEAAVAVVVPAAHRRPDPADLEAFLRERMAAFKVPRRWVLVDELPRTASGKVQKHVVQEQIARHR
ncbi:MAG TPA: class I adenylate-forming enzyme family protein [Acidimicrobiales bacterium]|nr:class I adenylate-forming enzyme family protein [Acidimicrobiales bacterium]